MQEMSKLFDLNWLCRYLRLEIINSGIGTKFSSEFAILFYSCSIKEIKSTRRNSQHDAAIEQMHQVMLNMLRALDIRNFI